MRWCHRTLHRWSAMVSSSGMIGMAASSADAAPPSIPTSWGAVIGSGISGIEADGDEPSCTAVADLIVDRLAIAIGAVADRVTIPPVAHVRHLAGQAARQTFMGARFAGDQPHAPSSRGLSGGE